MRLTDCTRDARWRLLPASTSMKEKFGDYGDKLQVKKAKADGDIEMTDG